MAIEVPGCRTTHINGYNICYRREVQPEQVLEAIATPGDTLKRSPKNETRRVGDWVVKQSLSEAGLGPLKRTLMPNTYRRAWFAANYLHAHGVHTPEPIAYVEKVRFGVVLANAMVCEYLNDCVNVEVYAKGLVEKNPEPGVLNAFFSALAGALSRLTGIGAYHADLSGKNIFTRDGRTFYFIDLDSVVLGAKYSPKLRFKNHVQLYDSFCDYCPDEMLVKFLEPLLPDPAEFPDWMQAVREGQQARRNRHTTRQKS